MLIPIIIIATTILIFGIVISEDNKEMKKTKYPSHEEMENLKFNYADMIWYLTQNTSLKHSEVYDIDGYSKDEFCMYLFEFYNKNLVWNRRFKCQPSYVIFGNENREGAKAKKSNKHYIIVFFESLIKKLENWFGDGFDITSIAGLNQYHFLSAKLNFPISKLIEQAILQFTFYHEFAHVIQFSVQDEFEREEHMAGSSQFDYQMHIEEFDADTFSGICLATHLFQFQQDWTPDNMTNTEIKNLISIITGSVMTYIISLPMCKTEFYTEECIHPHNSIRALNIIGVIITHLQEILNKRNIQIKLDLGEIFLEANNVCSHLLNNFGLTQELTSYQKILNENYENISKYHKKLQDELLNYDESAIKKWNLNN